MYHQILKEEINQLQGYMRVVLELLHLESEESRCRWKYKMVFLRSLGYRVPAEWVAREFKLKLKLDDEPEVFFLAEDYMILHFKNEGDCAPARAGDPWFVAGQLLALEP